MMAQCQRLAAVFGPVSVVPTSLAWAPQRWALLPTFGDVEFTATAQKGLSAVQLHGRYPWTISQGEVAAPIWD